MKNVLKIILVLGIFSMPLFSNAQKAIKLGHINSNDLLKMMPGRDSAQKVLEKHAKELETTLKGMQNELETRYQDFTANQAQMSELIKQTKTKELQDMQARIQDFQDNAQKDYQDKEKKILTPIIDRAKKAIEDVAAENKYTYVFDSGVGSLLYQDASEDILPLVKKKLGLK